MATIAAYGMKMPEFRDMVSHSEYDMPYINGGSKHCTTTNYFLTSGFPGANGIKTGTTNAGGPAWSLRLPRMAGRSSLPS